MPMCNGFISLRNYEPICTNAAQMAAHVCKPSFPQKHWASWGCTKWFKRDHLGPDIMLTDTRYVQSPAPRHIPA